MARYRKKPVVIEAIQWDGLNLEEIRRFVGSSLVYQIFDAAWKAGAGQPVVDMKIKTLEGEMQVGRGDYIIKGVRGEFYPCKPDIFKETYESEDTADVAPRAEAEKWFRECEELQGRMIELEREVAIEVLDEAIRAVYSKIDMKIYNTIEGKLLGDGVAFGKQQAMYDVIILLDELKKKYAEVKNGTK